MSKVLTVITGTSCFIAPHFVLTCNPALDRYTANWAGLHLTINLSDHSFEKRLLFNCWYLVLGVSCAKVETYFLFKDEAIINWLVVLTERQDKHRENILAPKYRGVHPQVLSVRFTLVES